MEDPGQEVVEDIGLVGRMIRVFYAPGETFDALRLQRTWLDWFAPTLLVAIVGMASAHLVGPLMVQEKMADTIASIQDNPNIPAEKRAEIVEKMEAQQDDGGMKYALVMAPIGTFIYVFILAGILLLFAKLALGGEIEYGQMLPVTAYASLIGVLQQIIVIPLMLQKQTAQIHTGLGVLVSDEMAKTFVGRLLGGVDLFSLWTVCIVGIGIAIVGNVPTRKAVTGTLIFWAIWIVIKAGAGGLLGKFIPGL